MSLPAILRPEAEADIRTTYGDLEQIREGLVPRTLRGRVARRPCGPTQEVPLRALLRCLLRPSGSHGSDTRVTP
jgi:hypothetical protein